MPLCRLLWGGAQESSSFLPETMEVARRNHSVGRCPFSLAKGMWYGCGISMMIWSAHGGTGVRLAIA